MDDISTLYAIHSRCQEDSLSHYQDGIELAWGELSRYLPGGKEESYILFLITLRKHSRKLKGILQR